jgi:hypothetical protein
MKRLLASIALAAGLVAGIGPAAVAAPTPTLPCPGFKVEYQVTGGGSEHILPGDRITLVSTNTTITLTGPSGTSVTYVINGTNHSQSLPGGGTTVTLTGRNLVLVPKANGHPVGIFLTVGTVSFTLNKNGSERTLFSGQGQVTDVCQLLAP